MCIACERGYSVRDIHIKIRDDINTQGWSCIGIRTTIPWAYTLGLYLNLGHPELIVFGLPGRAAQDLLRRIRDNIAQCARPTGVGAGAERVAAMQLQFWPVHPSWLAEPAHTFGIARRYWCQEVAPPALQVVWPDNRGLLPGQDGHAYPQLPDMRVPPRAVTS